MKSTLRLRNVEYGTIVRVIRVVDIHDNLNFRCRDETYGGLCWLPISQYVSGAWVIHK